LGLEGDAYFAFAFPHGFWDGGSSVDEGVGGGAVEDFGVPRFAVYEDVESSAISSPVGEDDFGLGGWVEREVEAERASVEGVAVLAVLPFAG